MLQVRNDLINLDNIKKIDDLVKKLEEDPKNIKYVSKEEAKDFDLDNQRAKELRNSTSLTHFGLHLIQCGGKIKKPVTLVIRKNKRKQVISGHNRHDRFISDANKGWPDMPTIQIPIEKLVALGVSDKDLHAWGAAQNPQLDPDLPDPMKKADLVLLVKKYCVRDLRVQEALAKDYLTQEHLCAKAYATEIIRVAKKELSRKAYENDTGKILVSWTDYKLKKKVEDFDEVIRASQRQGFTYVPEIFNQQMKWLRCNYYKTSGNGSKVLLFRVFSGNDSDHQTTQQEVHSTLQNKFSIKNIFKRPLKDHLTRFWINLTV